MVFAGRNGARSWEGSIQQLDIRDAVRLYPAPVRNRATAGAAHLIAQQLCDAIVNPIVVRLDDAILVSVPEPNQVSLLDRAPEQFIDLRPRVW
jgi:hypothetical protein